MFEFILFFSRFLDFSALTSDLQSDSKIASAVSNGETWLSTYKYSYLLVPKQFILKWKVEHPSRVWDLNPDLRDLWLAVLPIQAWFFFLYGWY